MFTLKPVGDTTRMNIASRMVKILLKRQLLPRRLILNLAMMESKRFRHTKASQSYIDNDFNPGKVNVIDPTKDNFTQSMTVK